MIETWDVVSERRKAKTRGDTWVGPFVAPHSPRVRGGAALIQICCSADCGRDVIRTASSLPAPGRGLCKHRDSQDMFVCHFSRDRRVRHTQEWITLQAGADSFKGVPDRQSVTGPSSCYEKS